MILHTINGRRGLEICRDLIDADDHVVLIEAGVYLATVEIPGHLHVLDMDADARGVDIGETGRIDHAQFVALCVQADKVCAWF